jgi:FixJ family two-component response regulator
MSGPHLQQELRRRGTPVPVVFITARCDTALQARLIAAGAVACVFKPFSDTALIEAVETALGLR